MNQKFNARAKLTIASDTNFEFDFDFHCDCLGSVRQPSRSSPSIGDSLCAALCLGLRRARIRSAVYGFISACTHTLKHTHTDIDADTYIHIYELCTSLSAYNRFLDKKMSSDCCTTRIHKITLGKRSQAATQGKGAAISFEREFLTWTTTSCLARLGSARTWLVCLIARPTDIRGKYARSV